MDFALVRCKEHFMRTDKKCILDPPSHFMSKGQEGKVYRLRKHRKPHNNYPLLGLTCFNKAIVQYVYKMFHVDHTVFVKNTKGRINIHYPLDHM